ncbi:MAG: helix-turn-helix transcriptional regulator [Lachnospiraceae bacterium]|nr:helix-turn-helix transcriptional regulator [Lachnospiraceae bacterium]
MGYAYDQIYLYDAMTNLGEFTEYAHYACDADLDRTFMCFFISGYADRFQVGDPQVVSGMSGTELYQAVMDKCGKGREPYPPALIKYDTDVYYWIGYILAYAQWLGGQSFKSIIDVVKTDDLMQMYPALHTVSEDRAAEEILELEKKRSVYSRLQSYRKRLGYTQAALAEKSGVNLRTLQQYEVGDKDISKAAAGSVISLARALHVEPEALI